MTQPNITKHSGAHPLRLLLVDDESAVRRSLQRALRQEGYEIESASDADSALRLLDQFRFDLVISDYLMPGRNGVELLTEVSRQHPATQRMMLSGEADLKAVVAAMNDGTISQFVTKPWANDALRQTIREVLANAVPRDAGTGWPTRSWFLRDLNGKRDGTPLAVVLAEVSNASGMLNLLRIQESAQVAKVLEQRLAALCEPVVSLCSIQQHLYGFAVPDEGIENLLEALTDAWETSIPVPSARVGLTFRFGIARWEDAAEDAEDFLRRAMVALSAVATESRAIRVYEPGLKAELHQRFTLENDMQRALDQEQFFCLFQPQVDATSHKVRGAEALVRWQHPMQGNVSPLMFIDIAERNGLIHSLGRWVLHRGVAELRSLIAQGADNVRISVNISPRQFARPGLADDLQQAIDQAGIDPQLLEVEITESSVMDQPKAARTMLQNIRDQGVRVALDDFGTGHSSLAQIHQLPLDVIKFDRAFIRYIETDQSCLTLLKHVSALAAELNLEVVAEGVENQTQADICRDLGCHLLQGFYFHRPLDSDALHQVLRAERQH